MNTNLLDYVLQKLEESRGTWPEIARRTEIAYPTIQKIVQGATKDPGFFTVQRLADYFKERDGL